jgi:hypothetical protein
VSVDPRDLVVVAPALAPGLPVECIEEAIPCTEEHQISGNHWRGLNGAAVEAELDRLELVPLGVEVPALTPGCQIRSVESAVGAAYKDGALRHCGRRADPAAGLEAPTHLTGSRVHGIHVAVAGAGQDQPIGVGRRGGPEVAAFVAPGKWNGRTVASFQRTRPVFASNANRWPSAVVKATSPPATVGEEPTALLASNDQRIRPETRSNA